MPPIVSCDEAAGVVALARGASIEINHADVKHLPAAQALLAAGTRIFVSHLPRQSWAQTVEACAAVRRAGFEPVPHLPVRLLPDAATLSRVLAELVERARASDVLLVAGDYAQPAGPYEQVGQVLASELLNRHGFERVCLAGHPEGHHQVELAAIRRAERDKARLAASLGLGVTLVTQFFFEAEPFVRWSRALRDDGVTARLIGGIAGPASAATLLRYALRCGVGPSIRALGHKPGSMLKLLGEHGPESLVRALARAKPAVGFDGVHLFCFGGFLRSAAWLHDVARGRIALTGDGGFECLA
jgi:methylenetetrahydrofolate reductase (NADPH)